MANYLVFWIGDKGGCGKGLMQWNPFGELERLLVEGFQFTLLLGSSRRMSTNKIFSLYYLHLTGTLDILHVS